MNQAKSIFQSKTFWGAVLTLIVAALPIVEKSAKDGLSIEEVFGLLTVLATTGLTIVGRVQADSSVYTPRSMPGPNKEDFQP